MSQLNNDQQVKQEIERYVNGQLTPREVDDLWEVLIQDGEHLEYLKNVANLKDIAQKRQAPETATKKRSYIYYAAAAVIVLMLATWGMMRFAMQPTGQMMSPVDNVELQYYRSADGALVANSDNAIRDAITLANDDNMSGAVALLEQKMQETEDTGQRVRMDMTLGSLLYNDGQYKKAISHFNRIIDQGEQAEIELLLLEKAHWYRGNAYLQTDSVNKARTDIKRVYDYNGAYRRVAERYLKSFSE